MDRQIVYPGGIPLDTDILNIERNIMVALGYLAQATLGTDIVVDGLVCAPTLPASMSVTIGPGCVTQFSVVDPLAFGSLPAAPTVPLMKLGINVETTTFTLTAPTASGQAIDYLLEASFLESDATPVILPYYNAASPGMPYSGLGNSGAPQNTQRLQSVQFQMKAGAPGGAGTQLPPNVDAGWVGLYVITLTTGQTAVTAANITVLPDAPFIAWKLPQLTPGTSRCAVFTPANQGNWNVPAGVNTVKVRIWGGGGAGGAGFSGAGGGGAGGGYAEGYCSVTPGQTYFVTVGNGGAGAGTSGGNSSFGNLMSAAGGQAGNNGAAGSGGTGGAGGALGAGGNLALMGQAGGSAFLAGSVWVSGQGGGAYGGAGAEAVVGGSGTLTDGHAATLPGCGGAGGIGSGIGGQGGQGLVLLEY